MRLLMAKELISTSVMNVEHGNQWNNQCLIMNSLFVSDKITKLISVKVTSYVQLL